MKGWSLVVLVAVGVLVIAGLPTLALTLASNESSSNVTTKTAGQGRNDHAKGHGPDKADKGDAKKHPGVRGQQGPPKQHRHGWAKPKDISKWQQLSPVQKSQLMARLAREHARGMTQWAKCVQDGGDDCTKPVPPGWAKRR